jgi:hypothetical protein
MKTFILLFSILFLEIKLIAQNVFPSLVDSPKWIVCTQMATSPVVKIYDTVSYEKDTNISGWMYQKFICKDINSGSRLTGYVRIFDKKVFIYKSGKDYLLYDFSLQTGDSVFCGYRLIIPDSVKMKVVKVDSVECNLIKRKRITLSYNSNKKIDWIEGVGSNVHPFYSWIFMDKSGSFVYIISLEENNVPVFQNCLNTSINDQKISKLNVFPNPFSENIILQNIPNGDPVHIYLFDLEGKVLIDKIVFSNSIDLSQLNKGFYIINVKTNTVNIYEKIIKN